MAVTLALAKQHLRVDGTDEDTTIAAYLAAAVAWVENYTGKKLVRGEVTQEVAALESPVALSWGPEPVDLSVGYTDADDVARTFDDLTIVLGRAYASWPTPKEDTPITLTYTAGFEATPADLDSAVLLMTGHFYANREAVNVGSSVTEMPLAVEALCSPYRSVLV